MTGGITFNNASYAGIGGTTTGGATNTAANQISGPVGTGVTSITEASSTNPLTVSGLVSTTGITLTNSGTATFTLSGGFNGSGNIIFNASNTGNIVLAGTVGTFSGTYTINAGHVLVSTQTGLVNATDAITVNGNSSLLTGGQLEILSAAAITIGNPITINGYGPTDTTGKSRRLAPEFRCRQLYRHDRPREQRLDQYE